MMVHRIISYADICDLYHQNQNDSVPEILTKQTAIDDDFRHGASRIHLHVAILGSDLRFYLYARICISYHHRLSPCLSGSR